MAPLPTVRWPEVLVFSALTAAATGLGAVPFLVVREMSRRWLGVSTSLAAGAMLGASVGLFYEGALYSAPRTLVGAAAGVVFIVVTRRAIGRGREVHIATLRGASAERALLVIGVMTVHSFTEGVGVGVSFGGRDETLGVIIAIAIAVHNIPEGLAISLTLVPFGSSVAQAAMWSVLSSVPQPVMAVPAYLAVRTFEPLLPAGLGFAGGAMTWMVFRQLLPEARATASLRGVGIALAASTAVMVALEVVLVL